MIANAISMPGGATLKDAGSNAGEPLARIDQYELVRELGGGGFGTVYLAKDTVSGVQYAVKGLPPFVKNNREELENIKANFTLVSRLSHTNIARAHVLHLAREVHYSSEDVRQKLRVDPGDTLMVMEYAPGVTLSQWRRQFPDRRVPTAQALEITRQIAAAIDYAHGQRIIHRDIKPANVMVKTRPDGELIVRVLDFGLAAEIRSSMGRVSREIHDTSGTRPYMAPEQWLGERQSPATDQYALAVLFHELVTGDVPFSSAFDTGDPVVMMNVVGREHAKLPEGLSVRIRAALARALAKKPEDRFASCGEFVAALEGKTARSPLSWLLIAGGVCAIVIGVAAAWWLDVGNGVRRTMPAPKPHDRVTPATNAVVFAPAVMPPVTNVQSAAKNPVAPPPSVATNAPAKPTRRTPTVTVEEQMRRVAEKTRIEEERKLREDIRNMNHDANSTLSDIKAMDGVHWQALSSYVSGTNLLAAGNMQLDKGELKPAFESLSSATNYLRTAYSEELSFIAQKKVEAERKAREEEAACKEREDTERKAREEEAKRKAQEEAERKAREEAKRREREKQLFRQTHYPDFFDENGNEMPQPVRRRVAAAPQPAPTAPAAPPQLTVRAMIDGREVYDAELKTFHGKFKLPYKWDERENGKLERGKEIAYEVMYSSPDNRLYSGTLKTTVDWNGQTNIWVELRQGTDAIRTAPKGIGSWAF